MPRTPVFPSALGRHLRVPLHDGVLPGRPGVRDAEPHDRPVQVNRHGVLLRLVRRRAAARHRRRDGGERSLGEFDRSSKRALKLHAVDLNTTSLR